MTEQFDRLADVISRQTDILAKMADGMHTKAPAVTNTSTLLHGVGGIFSTPGLERDIITAHVRPLAGIGSAVPVIPTVYTDPRFGSITGFTATVGAEPAYPCSDAPAGYMKGCNLTAQFGRIARQTQTIEIDRVITALNRGDFTDLILRGQLLSGSPGLSPAGMNQSDILNVVTKAEMIGVGVQFERKLSQLTWQGTPANNNAGGGYKEFPGLDIQINTGQMDADTNTLCPALDSDVKDFGYSSVDGNDKDIVEYVSMLEYYIKQNAIRMGLEPATWAFVMRPELWFELSAVWPCSYLSHRCQQANGTNILTINEDTNVRMRDDMRNNLYILVNGNRYQVIPDDGIFEHNNINNANLLPGEYASSIYMVPLTITGGFPVTYWEHVDYRRAAPDASLLRGKEMFWTDDGRFMWALEEIKFCYTLTAKIEPRIVLRTPQLAGKIQNVKYSPLQHTRDSDPASSYFHDGGVSLRSHTAPYAVWLARGQ